MPEAIDLRETTMTPTRQEEIDWTVAHLRRKYIRGLVLKITNKYFNEEWTAKIIKEVLAHKWIECEKAGRNIFSGDTEEERIVSAGQDWLSKGHFENFVYDQRQDWTPRRVSTSEE